MLFRNMVCSTVWKFDAFSIGFCFDLLDGVGVGGIGRREGMEGWEEV